MYIKMYRGYKTRRPWSARAAGPVVKTAKQSVCTPEGVLNQFNCGQPAQQGLSSGLRSSPCGQRSVWTLQ